MKMTCSKKHSKREIILNTAFTEWGRTNFVQTSLSAVTDKLGLTKPALYRHFSGKEDIVRSMEQKFLQDYAEMHDAFFNQAPGLGFEETVKLLIRGHFQFYYDNPYYYIFFLIHMLKTPFSDRHEIHTTMKAQVGRFEGLFSEAGIKLSRQELITRLHFLYVAGTFWFSRDFIDQETRCAVVPEFTAPEIEKTVTRCAEFCFRGVYRGTSEVHYGEIEKTAFVETQTRPPQDKIFSAIEEAVEEFGLREASLDRIAAKAGITKSSLYFYFRNKEDMFAKLIEQEQTLILSILKEKMSALKGFAEESYCYMVVTASHTLNNPALLNLLNWLRFQNIGIPIKPPTKRIMLDYFSFMNEAFLRGELKAEEDDIFQAATFLHVLSFRLINDFRTANSNHEAVITLLRSFHRLYLFGLSVDNLLPDSGAFQKEHL